MLGATSTPQSHTPILRTTLIATILTGVLAIVILAFSWPAVTANPKDVSLAIAGPETAVTAMENKLKESGSDVFSITIVDNRDEAVTGIESRDYQGAIILGQEPELLTASANGAVNQVVARLEEPLQQGLTAQTQAAAAAAGIPTDKAPEVKLTVTDIAPYSADDPSGSLLSSAMFPMLLGGMLGGTVISTVVQGTSRRLVGLGVYALIGGIVLACILQLWFGSIQGDFWTNVTAFTFAIAAISGTLIGCVSLMGMAGAGLGGTIMMLFANPISGAALPAQFLPGAWGTIGQCFPPGAAATLVRELSYFPNANMSFSWLVLLGWITFGVALTYVGEIRNTRKKDAAIDAAPAEKEPVKVG